MTDNQALFSLGPTHGRHCRCSSCAREDWGRPDLGPCGMHGSGCPPVYDPYSPLDALAESFAKIRQYVREQEIVLAVNPDDLTDEMRSMIEAAPLTTLRESRYVERGKLFVIHPGLLEDLSVMPRVA